MYIKIKNEATTYPYNINLLYSENPNTSFPNTIETDYESLKRFGVYRVISVQKPSFNPLTDKCVELTPRLLNNVWTQQWQVEPLSNEESQTLYDSKAAEIRAERYRLLIETDWTQLKDVPVNVSSLWVTYREQLRDVSIQPGFPFEVVWPTAPSA